MCRLSIIRKLTEFSTSYFYNSVVKTSLRVLGLFKEWRTGLRAPIIGKFLSVFVYLARLSSVGVLSVIFRDGELILFFFWLSSVGSDLVRPKNGIQGILESKDSQWNVKIYGELCCVNLDQFVSVASPRLDTLFNHNVIPYFLVYRPLSGSEICCKCSS